MPRPSYATIRSRRAQRRVQLVTYKLNRDRRRYDVGFTRTPRLRPLLTPRTGGDCSYGYVHFGRRPDAHGYADFGGSSDADAYTESDADGYTDTDTDA